MKTFLIFALLSYAGVISAKVGVCRLELMYSGGPRVYEILIESTGRIGARRELIYDFYEVKNVPNPYSVLHIKDTESTHEDFNLMFRDPVYQQDRIFNRYFLISNCFYL